MQYANCNCIVEERPPVIKNCQKGCCVVGALHPRNSTGITSRTGAANAMRSPTARSAGKVLETGTRAGCSVYDTSTNFTHTSEGRGSWD